MQATIGIAGNNLSCKYEESAASRVVLDLEKLMDWHERYVRDVAKPEVGILLAMGREIFQWLDGDNWASGWIGHPVCVF
jgi:hypothetical protein